MVYRQVTMLEVKEILGLWLGGVACKRIAAPPGLNVKTVRRHIAAAETSALQPRRQARRPCLTS
jgi:hypothetical protein